MGFLLWLFDVMLLFVACCMTVLLRLLLFVVGRMLFVAYCCMVVV